MKKRLLGNYSTCMYQYDVFVAIIVQLNGEEMYVPIFSEANSLKVAVIFFSIKGNFEREKPKDESFLYSLGLVSKNKRENIWAVLLINLFLSYILAGHKLFIVGFSTGLIWKLRHATVPAPQFRVLSLVEAGSRNSALIRMSSEDEYESCLKCRGISESEDNKLLVCCENECPIVLHEECMPVQPQFDEMGNFYCPCCAYKRVIQLRKKKDKMLNKAALTLADWISMASEGDSEQRRREVEENVGVSARQVVEDVRGGEREQEREPVVTDKQGMSNRDEVLGKRVAKEEDYGARKLPKSFSTSFESPGRRKVFWTKEEEQALKEGVRKFWTEDRKNIPWEKIIQAYKDRFDNSRTAANLKDKWKNMTKAYFGKKEGCVEDVQVPEVK